MNRNNTVILFLLAAIFLALVFGIFGCGTASAPAGSTTTNSSITTTTNNRTWITDHVSRLQTNLAKPPVGVPYSDPVFGATVMRLTDAASMGALVGNSCIVPEYSKRQAWNCDDSYILLRGGDGAVLLYNGSTYQFIKKLPSDVVGGDDIFWHPTNNKLIYYTIENRFYSFNVDTEENNLLRTLVIMLLSAHRARVTFPATAATALWWGETILILTLL